MIVGSSVVPPGAGAPSESTAVYKPHLDGLRAVAVYLVVLFHAGSASFSGGYVGVDVFFVLSGFLVTQLLLRDVVRSGSIELRRFYARRFRRLLPAAFVTLIVTAVVYTAIASPAEVADAVGSFKAAFLYSTNWYFIHQSTGYFGADVSSNPVLHFWSLAVEEQFYLVWPLALGGAFALTRRMDRDRQIHAIRIAVIAGALASAAWALALRHSNPNRAYYGTDTRAYELLAGALIALVPTWVAWAGRFVRSARIATAASLLAIVVLASSWVHLDAIERGIAVTIATCVLIVALEEAAGDIVNGALSNPSVVYLGKISYGTYLWHWLVIVVIAKSFHVSTSATVWVAMLVATALAALSYEILEHPVRTSKLLDRHRAVVIATGLAISVASALVLIPAIVDPESASAPAASSSITAGFTPVPANLDWRHAKGFGPRINCFRKPADACTIVHGTGRHLMLIGDSHAWMLTPTFTAVAKREHLTLSVAVTPGCPWQRGLGAELRAISSEVPGNSTRCTADREDLYRRVIPALHPDVIVAVNLAYETGAKFSNPHVLRLIETRTTQSLAALRADGRRILLVEPIPRAPFQPIVCISRAKVLEQCRYTTTNTPDGLERFYRRIAASDHGVLSVDFDHLVCPFLPICDPVVNGELVKLDQSHITVKFAQSIAPAVDEYLKQAGVIAG